MMAKIYKGERIRTLKEGVPYTESVVRVNGRKLPLRLELSEISPTGFEWGYGGSGPAQLALAILANFFGKKEPALEYHQAFKWNVIAKLKGDQWELTDSQIASAINDIMAESKNYYLSS